MNLDLWTLLIGAGAGIVAYNAILFVRDFIDAGHHYRD